MKKLSLTAWIFIALVVGVISGLIFKGTFVISVAVFVATLFTRMLGMLIVPLIFTSIVSGMFNVGGADKLGRLGGRTLLYYMSTSLIAILTGLVLVNIIQPGVGVDLGLKETVKDVGGGAGSLIEVFIRMIPANVVDSAAKGQMLPVILFCVLLGFGITKLPRDHTRKVVEDFFSGGFKVMMTVTQLVLLFAPIGIWGFMTKLMATTGFAAFKPLGLYALTVLAALFIHGFITLPLGVVSLLAKKNPVTFAKHMGAALMTAFSTASSSATLPLTLRCIEQNAKVSNKISSFVLPLGATVNMDGTALYECVAVIFIAQAYGQSLGFAQQMVIVVTALLASIGAAGIPMAGLVMMSIVLTAVGLPLEGVGLIIAVDRILDMCRTTVNAWSDSCGALLIGTLEGEVGKADA
ncbi:dicarboxylate/amino acid:cation symporter [Elusimicrobiota bacterium]